MPAPWSLPKRIAFRFAFAYLVLYNLPFPLDLFAWFGNDFEWWDHLWEAIVRPVGKAVFGVNPVVVPTGSGDTTFAFVPVFCIAVIATIVTVIWSLLDRRREEYARIDAWLRMYVRFALAATMMVYAAAKVVPSQFQTPTLSKLSMTFGDQSPMGLLWSFMGASKPYTIFGGLMELIPALLLTMRRTVLLGSLLAIAVMSNVVMLNLCYDVPVKLYSSHLLLMAVFLAAPHVKRLADFFIFNRATEPQELPRLLPESWSRVAVPAIRTGAVVFFTGWMLRTTYDRYESFFTYYPKPALYGMWNVEEFDIDGRPHPPLVTDGDRWRTVIFDYSTFNVRQMNDVRVRLISKVDAAKKQITLRQMQAKAPKPSILTYTRTKSDTLVLQGVLDGKTIHASLHRVASPDFFLMSRGFHWINEHPVNR